MKRLCLLILLSLAITGCSTKHPVVQVDGIPVPDNIIRARVFALNGVVTYYLKKNFNVVEDDEYYKSFKYLALLNDGDTKVHQIKKDDTLEMVLNVFNPEQRHYIIKQLYVRGGAEKEEVYVYNGDLSRNEIRFRLPSEKRKDIQFYFDLYDENNLLIYRSFKAQYCIEGENVK